MGTLAFTATSISPSMSETVSVNIADADLSTLITYAATQGGPVDGQGKPWTSTSTGSPQPMTPTEALQWLANSLLSGTLGNVQRWQYDTAKAAVAMPALIAITPSS